MARPRQPIELIMAKGKKHLTKEEIAQRTATEVQPCADGIRAPEYLTKAEQARFDDLAGKLAKIKVMGETDCDTLARYVTAQTLYEAATKKLRAAMKKMDDPYELESLARLQDRYYKQAQTTASSLGLTVTSRCKLVVPVKDEPEKVNKFARFAGGKAVGGA